MHKNLVAHGTICGTDNFIVDNFNFKETEFSLGNLTIGLRLIDLGTVNGDFALDRVRAPVTTKLSCINLERCKWWLNHDWLLRLSSGCSTQDIIEKVATLVLSDRLLLLLLAVRITKIKQIHYIIALRGRGSSCCHVG